MEDKRQAAALFRYSLIRELADDGLSPRQRGTLIRALVAADHAQSDGRRATVSAPSLRRWLRAWRQGGFKALLPVVRRQPNRTPAELLEAAETLKREAPKRTAAQVARALSEAGLGKVSERTLQRYFARLGLDARPDGQPPRALGRFEAHAFGELWTGDAMHGPVVGGAKAILFAFIDDWSRAVVGWRWGHSENTVRLEAALRRALESVGVPSVAFVDNGSCFVSAPFLRTLGVLGIRIAHSTPGHAASRGKIERFFRTVRDQFLVELEARAGAQSLTELNELFGGWLEGVYHRTEHSETGQTPLARRMAGRTLRRPAPAELREAFLWSERRRVTKTASISLHGNEYEVDPALAGVWVELLFDPFDLSDIEVRYQGRPMGKAVPRHIGRHTHPKARPEAAPPPKASGIDYLRLISERMSAEERARLGIDYSGLAAKDEPGQDTDTRTEEGEPR